MSGAAHLVHRPEAADVLTSLLELLGLPADRVTAQGRHPLVASPYRLGDAMAAAIAVQAAAVIEVWRLRSGRMQYATIDIRRALHAINPGRYLKQNGYPVGMEFNPPDPGFGFFQAGDGRWVAMTSLRAKLRDGILDLLGCPNTRAAIVAAVRHRSADELEDAAGARSLPLVAVRSAAEWRAHPHARLLQDAPVITIHKIADGAPQPLGLAPRPLSGVRVLDASHILAGPGLVRTLAEQGADALRISQPCYTDQFDMVLDTGFGKRTAFLDLAAPADAARLHTLCAEADVFVQSYRPGSMARRGFSPEALAASHPGLIYVSVSCFGLHDGPWSHRVGFDPIAQAATGINQPDGGNAEPVRAPTGLVADYMTAYLGAAGTLGALLRRAREGGSYHVQVSLARTCMWLQDQGRVHGPGDASPGRPILLRMPSPFGELEYLAPVTSYSETPAYWDKPPLPLGASRPAWDLRS